MKKLNLGCGYRKRGDGFINIDNRAEVEPDIVCDVTAGLPFDDDSIEYVLARDFLEHIPIGKTIQVVEEIHRVLIPGGKFESLTPSTDGRGAFADPTHVSFWNRESWRYYTDDEYRALYGIKAKFDGHIQDHVTNDACRIIHTHALLTAIKRPVEDAKVVVAELVDGCGLKCAICWNRHRKGTFEQMSLETARKVIDRYDDPKHMICWYNWGEPLLYKEFEIFAEMVGKSKASNMISSSLSLDISDERLESLANFNHINISISGLTAAVYNIYHTNGKFDLVMKNIGRLAALKLSGTSMIWLTHKHNAFQTEHAMGLAKSMGFRFVEQHLNCEVEDLVAGFDHELLKDPKFPSKEDDCHIRGWDIIDVNGNYLLCCASHNVKIGHSIDSTESIDPITRNKILTHAKLKTPLCIDCKGKEYWRMF